MECKGETDEMEGVENASDRPDKEEMPPNPALPERMNFKLRLKQGGSCRTTSADKNEPLM